MKKLTLALVAFAAALAPAVASAQDAPASTKKAADSTPAFGIEVCPKDIGLGGITGNSGARIRVEMNTTDFNSIRPTAGVVSHF